ncbi:AraC family transcriptional regulator [Pseudorhodoplanes sinuspersici]|uniref:helix-turn-helix transcriptional regulator n=1 Tax=Pseudorhodoplanes sinuspersici TaxID=1235591 RepID=UPI00315B29B6
MQDVICTSGPADKPFEEMHDEVCIAIVTSGTFRYRTRQGEALMTPGTLLLGNAGACFECGHEHATGDRCLSFHFTQRFHEAAVSAVSGAGKAEFDIARLPCLPRFARVIADAETARDENDISALEEAAVRLAGGVATMLRNAAAKERAPSPRDIRRIAETIQRIEAKAGERFPLTTLAHEAAMSPYHFLRTFRRIVGMTPHQYVLRMRLHRAAVRIRRTKEPISTIALDCGFDDLSTFNRRFRDIMGVNPRGYRFQSSN